ncbi:protein-arginine omega-N symmetric methyltransferase [Aureococcus anophagefferens]|nr:protein-arginine omega-N symmetric methyltransferase [Aureococcus anophagefferens]
MLKLATVAARRLAARHHRCMRRLSSKEFDFTVDRTGLGKVGYESSPSAVQAPETPLGLELGSQILARGPLSVYEYMRQCLLHPRHGYYARSGAERNFGAGGDFVTAPKLSQLFGELVGVWFVSEWVRLGEPEKVRLVEVGPGRGTLLGDVLRATAAWPKFRRAASDVRLVEPSASLRLAQRRTLGARPATHAQKPDAETPVTWALDGFGDFGTRATWHESLDEIDDDGVPTLLVGQEVLDAFPAYQFVKTDNGWREKLVDLADAGPDRFRFVLAPSPTPASRALAAADAPSLATKDGEAETLEVAPGALAFVSPLREPGLVDLTVDADFGACGDRAAAVDGAAAFGAVDQGEWLQRMGIVPRLEALLNLDDITESQVEDLISACERLLDPEQMGERARSSRSSTLAHRSRPRASYPATASAPPPT